MPSVISLFDLTGTLAKPWLASHHVYQFDMQLEPHQGEHVTLINGTADTWKEELDRLCREEEISIILSQTPCNDLAVSGSRWFKKKFQANPNYRQEAMELVYIARDLGEKYNIPYAIENPVSVISTEWKRPSLTFHPFEYGGYLPVNDDPKLYGPLYQMTPAQDRYYKKTCIWSGAGFVHTEKRPVEPIPVESRQSKLGGKSDRTKNLRSACARGWALAVYEANSNRVVRTPLGLQLTMGI